MNRRITLAVASLVLALSGLVLTVHPAAAVPPPCADGTATHNIVYNNTWFWNNWNGTTVNGNHVNFNNVHNDGYNDWCLHQLGTVIGTNCTTSCWPFAEGSGMNARYNGRPVYRVCWEHSQAYCIDWGQYDNSIHNGRAVIVSGSSDRLYEVVESAGSYWAPVWANDLEYAMGNGSLLPILLGTQTGSIGQGGGLWMNPAGGKELQFNANGAELCHVHC